MTKQVLIAVFIAVAFLFSGCAGEPNKGNSQTNSNETKNATMKNSVDTTKRNILVKKYDLLNFPNNNQPILLTIDEFFDGNNDEASIAPNLSKKPNILEYFATLKKLNDNPKTVTAFVEIKDVMLYDGKLDDNEWFYTDIIYIIGDLTKEEITEATKHLIPDEVEYNTENHIVELNEKYKGKKVVYIWWD